MATFSSSFQAKLLSFINITGVLFIIFLLVNSCSATRPGATLMRDEDMSKKSEYIKPHRRLYETSFRHQNHIFNFLPKGAPIPPSGPSKKHNSIENWATCSPWFFILIDHIYLFFSFFFQFWVLEIVLSRGLQRLLNGIGSLIRLIRP
jgi:hypothetical protein